MTFAAPIDHARLAKVAFGDAWLALVDPSDAGACDPFECMLNQIGIDRTQFSGFQGGGRVELLYSLNQGQYSSTAGSAGTATCGCRNAPDIAGNKAVV